MENANEGSTSTDTQTTFENPSSNNNKGRGRGRGNRGKGPNRGGRGGQQNQPPKEKSLPGPIAPPLKPDPNNRPKPKALSTNSTPLKNDPMWQDFEMEGFDGLTAYQPRCQFASTAEGYQGLTDRTYGVLNSADSHFVKHVSRSMFSYYSWQHYYARVISIKKHRADESFQEDRYHEFMRNETYPVPSVQEEYLRSIGTTTDNTGVEYRLTFPAWPNQQGHFARVSENTHYLYESMAAPVVISQRILEDLAYTINPQHPRNWNLPEGIRPQANNAGLPTKNMLGWAPATTLTTEQRQMIESSGIDVDGFHPNIVQFQLNKSLFESISDRVKKAEAKIRLGASVHESVNGSIAQVQWQERDQTEPIVFDRNEQYSEGTVRQMNNCLEDKRLTLGALMCAFRVRKEPVNQLHNYCCYDFNDYTEVPANWQATRNTIWNTGNVERWNLSTFRSAFTNKDPMRTAWIRKMLKASNRD